jgi:hypothetical protein
MKRHIQHSTFNIQRPRTLRRGSRLESWALNVKCSMFLLLSTLPICVEADTNALPALAPAYGELPPTFWEQHESTVIVAGFAFLAVAFLFLRGLLRPETKVILPPEVVAREAMTRLLRQPEDGKRLSEVSQILRGYVVTAFELPPGEVTTTEFCTAVAGHEKIGPALAKAISEFLRECDRRKFSTAPAAAPLDAATSALELVALAEKRRAELRGQTPAEK